MYCDSNELEQKWFYWILGSASLCLENYRTHRLLWTKIIGYAKHDGQILLRKGIPLLDPSYPERLHCLAFADPIYFKTVNGIPEENVNLVEINKILDLSSDSPLHKLDEPFKQSLEVIPNLKNEGYILEKSTPECWHSMLCDIRRICDGISTKFKLPNEDDQQELASKAFLQIVEKLINGRLKYIPGRAPVFNLLTTTTYRIIYSILNKQTHQKHGMRKLLEDAAAGILPIDAGRSIRVPRLSKRVS